MLISGEKRGAVEVLASGAMWSAIGIFVSELTACGATTSLIGFMRMAFGFAILAPLAAARRSLWVSRNALLPCAMLGLCLTPFNICYNLSVEANGMAAAAVLLYSAPVFTALASCLLLGERFARRKLLALAVNVAGCVLAVAGGGMFERDFSAFGILCGVGAGFSYGMIPILGKLAERHANPLSITMWGFFFSAISLLVLTRPPLRFLSNVRLSVLGLLYGLFSAALPYLLYYSGVGRIRDASRVPVLASIELVGAALLGVALYSETLGAANLLGVLLVLASIVLYSR